MAFNESFKGKPDSLCHAKTLDRLQSIGGTGRSEPAGGSKKKGEGVLVQVDQDHHPFFRHLFCHSPIHKTKSPLSSSSASLYLLKEQPFLTRKIISADPFI